MVKSKYKMELIVGIHSRCFEFHSARKAVMEVFCVIKNYDVLKAVNMDVTVF
jgi:hypothetical protein